MTRQPRPGPRNLITDVPGVKVGHATDEGVRTGVTVIRPASFPVAAIDLRGGGPASRETDILGADKLLSRVHALVLAGGSVFGLAAGDGVAAALSAAGTGLHLQEGSPGIPLVPTLCLHDLGNGGDKGWGEDPPYRRLGRAALESVAEDFALGATGAGRGAMAGIDRGGLGSASLDLGDGLIVGALAAVNCVGSVRLPGSEVYWAWPHEIDGEFGGQRPTGRESARDPFPLESRLGGAGKLEIGANTTLAVIAISAEMTPGEARRVAVMAQDGIARAVRPAHLPYDGDAVVVLAMGPTELPGGDARSRLIARLGSASADTLARAIARGVFEAGR